MNRSKRHVATRWRIALLLGFAMLAPSLAFTTALAGEQYSRDDILRLTREIRNDPSNDDLYNKRSQAWWQYGELDNAIADISEAIRLDPDAVYYRNRGIYRGKKGETDKALRDYTEAIRLGDRHSAPYVNRGLCWMDKGEYDRAMEDFTQAIRLDEEHCNPYNKRGNCWATKGDHHRAIQDFDQAIRVDPKDWVPYSNRGDSWDAMGEHDRAIQDYNQAIRLDPTEAGPYINRGTSWLAIGEYDRALQDFNQANRLDPKKWLPYHNRAWLLATCPSESIRNGERAVADATTACQLNEWKVATNLDTLAAAYAEAGDFPNAVKWQTKARDMVRHAAKDDYQSRLDLYLNGKPYRQEQKAVSEVHSTGKVSAASSVDGSRWKGLFLYSIPWSCDKCARHNRALVLAGAADRDNFDRTDRYHDIWCAVQKTDTVSLPTPEAALKRYDVQVKDIDTRNSSAGVRTIKEAYRANNQHRRADRGAEPVLDGYRYQYGAASWKANNLVMASIPCACQHCGHKNAPIQLLCGKTGTVHLTETSGERRSGTAEYEIGLSSFLHPNDQYVLPDPVEVMAADDNYEVHKIDFDSRSEGLRTLRREWEKAHRD